MSDFDNVKKKVCLLNVLLQVSRVLKLFVWIGFCFHCDRSATLEIMRSDEQFKLRIKLNKVALRFPGLVFISPTDLGYKL